MAISSEQFLAHMRRAFWYLECRYGFRVASSSVERVHYESDGVFVDLVREAGTATISVRIGSRVGPVDRAYSLTEVLSAFRDGAVPALTEEDVLLLNAWEVAVLLRNVGHALLQGDTEAFRSLARRPHGRERP
jgi:hypothetical protein